MAEHGLDYTPLELLEYGAKAGDPRATTLLDAAKCILSSRQAAYGAPEDNFLDIALLWNSYFAARIRAAERSGVEKGVLVDVSFEPHDVAAMMILMKVARLATNPMHKDSWVDIAGYAGCGARCAQLREKKP